MNVVKLGIDKSPFPWYNDYNKRKGTDTMKILKTYRFKNGAEVAHIADYAEATRYSGIIRYFVVADSAKVEVGTFFDWKDAKEKALSL